MLNQNLLLTGDNGYNLTKSLRFRSSASAYLNRTPASAGNRKTWTLSTWVKRGKLSADTTILSAGYSTNPWFVLQYVGSDNTLAVSATAGTSASWKTSAVFRDPSAWYHVVCVVDTTSSTTTITNTSTDRIRLYVNNVQQTLSGGTVPTQNSDLQVNNTVSHTIGGYSSEYFDGYMTEINFIDGQALTPSSFGSTNALTGVWQPAKYTGTYGTNGFYLPFTNTTSTTTLGYDFSGNSNNWTTNNLSLTAGTTYDSMNDVPTLTSATTANYATLNPLMFRLSNTPAATLSNGNLTSTHTPSGYGTYVFSTIAATGGKFYYEVTITSLVGGGDVGIDNGQGQYSLSTGRAVYLNDGRKIINGSISAYGASFTTGDVIGVAFDLINGTITFYKNGTSQGVASSSIGTSAYFSFGEGDTGSVYNWNFGQRPFSYTPPTGFVALNTFNLPTSTIVKGNTVMDATTYTGNGTGQSIVNAAPFKPDFVWIKCRTTAYQHNLYDSVRGVQNVLVSDQTYAENISGAADLTAFNSNGFTIRQTANYELSASGQTYVGWQWQAGQGTNTTNTNGSITSTVSVNASAGFSVVTYTGTGSNATVGHGLGVAPSMIIVKRRDAGASGWSVYFTTLPAGYVLSLQSTAAQANSSGRFTTTLPTSSVFSIGTDSDLNASAGTYVAYCWSEIAGFSKFGSYTGNGSADGSFVYLGFRPRFVMIKRSDAGAVNWYIFDTARDTYNAAGLELYPNLSNAEADGRPDLDILSNGFKIRSTSGGQNTSGATYIYACFAENPFKNALAR